MMLAILHALGIFACDLLKSKRRLQAENLFLRVGSENSIHLIRDRWRIRT
jgi:hypothetical protein